MMGHKKSRSEFLGETIAVWYREKDKIELHLRRDGRAFYHMLETEVWTVAVENTTMDLVLKWLQTREGWGFERIDWVHEEGD